MQTFSTNPLKLFRSKAGTTTALATITALLAISIVSYSQSQPDYPTTLKGYYEQQIDWQGCYEIYQCTELLVPIDYANLSTGTFEITVLKYPTTNENKLGSLIVNPGGPGGSGVDYAYAAEYLFSPAILNAYDIVGFDPRGVSRSEPIICLTDRELDANYASDAKPDNDAEFQQILQDTKKYVEKCKDKNKYLTSYSTANVARDLDILREALGDKQLNYMGKSYGTYLGTLYAHFFPNKVGRMVLDGAVDPTISDFQQSLTQAIGFDNAFAAFAADCNEQSECPLPTDKDEAIEFMKRLFNNAAKEPLEAKNNRLLSESTMVLGTASALYDSATGWPDLRAAIAQAKIGQSKTFLKLADEYTGRLEDGGYRSNEFDSAAIIDCLDFTDTRSIKEMKKDAQTFTKQAPLFGPYLAYSGIGCRYFDAPRATKFVPTKTFNPIVIIGTTGDPATPYQWAQGLNKILTNSVLLSLTGDGHTGQGQGNGCIDKSVDSFLLIGTVPRNYSMCGG